MRQPRKSNRRKGGEKLNLDLYPVEPLTDRQLEMFASDKNVVAHGSAGTGKTFVASYLGYSDILKEKYSRLIYIRSAVPTRDMGFLPGTDKEKAEVYEAVYKDIANELFDCGTAYDTLKSKNKVQFMTTSFIRGTTLRDAVVIVDECQNMTYHELDSVITRVGENCRVFFCGDMFQADLRNNGIKQFYDVLRSMDEFDFIEFTTDDIVRSEFVKNYLIAKYATHGDRQLP